MSNKVEKSGNTSPKKRTKMPLTDEEKSIAKNLLNKNEMTGEEIAKILSTGREKVVNIGRMTEVKKNNDIIPASDEKTAEFIKIQEATDLNTGLNFYRDERIIRSRESMILAVQIFNNPAIKFKAEFFSILAITAWSYLLIEYYVNKKSYSYPNHTPAIRKLIDDENCPLDEATKANILRINKIRNNVSHGKEIGNVDSTQSEYYQSCCLNFNEYIKELLDEKYGLEKELTMALQFSKFNIEQIEVISRYDLPESFMKLNELEENLSEEILNDPRYKYSSVLVPAETVRHYNLSETAQKSTKTLTPDDLDYALEEMYPYKATEAAMEIARRINKKFTTNYHANAWRKYQARPSTKAKKEDRPKTKKVWCYYLEPNYKYSRAWIDFLVSEVEAGEDFS